jgi:hypothetical protein
MASMTNGYEAARRQRNWLERLGELIPGYRGFQDRELRRDVDRLQREHLSRELGRLKAAARNKARAHTDAGRIGLLDRFDRLDRRLDGLSQAVRFADYGQSGLFDAVKIGEPELERLYELDLSFVEAIAALGATLASIPAPGAGDASPALEQAADQVEALAERWSRREEVIGDVVRSAG